MERHSALIEFSTSISPGMPGTRAEKIAQLELARKAARQELEEFFAFLRTIDPGLLVSMENSLFPVVIITANEPAMNHLREHPPMVIKSINATTGVTIPEGHLSSQE